ncbi:MAG: type II CAAX endopeptidase family protein [Desulfotomaculaceae bacterium]
MFQIKNPIKNPKIDNNFIALRWSRAGELSFVVLSYLAVVGGLYLAFQVFTTQRVALNFITFGPVTLFGLGVALPLLWTVKKGRTLADVGITGRHAGISITLGLIFSLFQYSFTLHRSNLPSADVLIPLIMMSLVVGLFEAVFFRGWMQLRFEEAFGIIPGIVLGAGCYAFYHVGYGMTLDEITFLFFIGLVYAIVFRLSKNIFILWPFLTPMGGLYANINEGLSLPFEATYGFILVLALMVGLILILNQQYRKNIALIR